MYTQLRTPSTSPKYINFASRNTFTNEINYKQRANILFDKLNTFKNDLENEKHEKFCEVLQQLKSIKDKLEITEKEKHQHYDRVLSSVNQIDKQINLQNVEFNRFKKILQNLIDTTNRQCQSIFNKITKESEYNQLSISKFIDFKIEAFVLKNKRVWLEQDIFNFQPFKEELNYLKKQVQQFYKNQQKQLQKLKREVSDSLDKQKEFLLAEMKRTDHDDMMLAIGNIYADISKKVSQMTQKRQNVEKNVLSMIENVIDSYVRDTNKFK